MVFGFCLWLCGVGTGVIWAPSAGHVRPPFRLAVERRPTRRFRARAFSSRRPRVYHVSYTSQEVSQSRRRAIVATLTSRTLMLVVLVVPPPLQTRHVKGLFPKQSIHSSSSRNACRARKVNRRMKWRWRWRHGVSGTMPLPSHAGAQTIGKPYSTPAAEHSGVYVIKSCRGNELTRTTQGSIMACSISPWNLCGLDMVVTLQISFCKLGARRRKLVSVRWDMSHRHLGSTENHPASMFSTPDFCTRRV